MPLFFRISSKEKPVVVVTGPDKRLPLGWWASRFLLKKYGVVPVYVTPLSPQLPDKIDGVVISGGDDIEPRHYGFTGDAKGSYNPARDELEINVISQALLSGIPIFGICRGAQLLNVVLGGNLYTDIRELRKHTPNHSSVLPVKWANFRDDQAFHHISQFKKHGGLKRLRVNQLHHQAIKDLGKNLSVLARDEDHFIQAVHGQSASGGKLIGVQWHPEYMPYSKYQRGIFRYFVSATWADGAPPSLSSPK